MCARVVFLIGLLSISAPAVRATTLRALDLPEIVQQAEIIADVTVMNLESYWASPAGEKAIWTKVSFALNRPALKGQVNSPFSLNFLGGAVGNRHIVVVGMPQLKLGQRVLIFSYGPDKVFASPLVGMDQGVLRIVRDNQRSVDRVYRWWGQPVNESQRFKERIPIAADTSEQTLQSANSVDEFLGRLRQIQDH